MARGWLARTGGATLLAVIALLLGAAASADGLGGGGGTDPVCCLVPPDNEPDPFDFTDLDGVMPGVTVTSAPVTLTGFDEAQVWPENGDLDIDCDGWVDTYRGNDGWPYVTAGTVVCVRQVVAPTCGTSTTTILHVGAGSADFTTTTQQVVDGCINPPAADGAGFTPWLLLAGVLLAGRRRRAPATVGRA